MVPTTTSEAPPTYPKASQESLPASPTPNSNRRQTRRASRVASRAQNPLSRPPVTMSNGAISLATLVPRRRIQSHLDRTISPVTSSLILRSSDALCLMRFNSRKLRQCNMMRRNLYVYGDMYA